MKPELKRVIWPVLALVALCLYNVAVGNPLDASTVLLQSAKVMLVAVGMTLVIATGGIDLSVGSVMAIAGATGGVLSARMGMPLPVALGGAVAAGLAVGLANGLLVTAARIQPIIATLVFMVLGRGVAMLITGGRPVGIDDPGFLALGDLGPLVALVVAVTVATAVAVRATALGLFVAAVGDNSVASRLCGLPASAIKVSVYVFSGFTAALAGVVAAARVETADATRLGELVELDAIFAVVVGGTALTGGKFSLAGSLVGALLIQVLSYTMINQGMPPEITPVPKALVIGVICLLQSPAFRGQVARLLPGGRGAAAGLAGGGKGAGA